jgi:DNA-binding transcriptional regulator/RsmH inhibitor MraZ
MLYVHGAAMTELNGDGCLTLPREIRNAPEFEGPEIVFIERHGFIEVWSMAMWNQAMNS